MTAAAGVLTIERFVPHAPPKIWRALTEGPLLERWLMANDFQPVVGHRFNLRVVPDSGFSIVIDGEVLTVEPFDRLAYRWDTSPQTPVPTLETIVTWTLKVVPGGTLVRMEQSGFEPANSNAFAGAGHAWPRFLENLTRVVATLS
jgi:uncharacterized protein YndB with AHSA1/START domain